MHIQCLGQGSPTVIFESGLGSDLHSWDSIFTELQSFRRVCRYDRKGYGKSEYKSSQDITQQNKDLSQLLKDSGIKGEKVLVGHSAGGLYLRHYLKHDSLVRGLVLIDSSKAVSPEEIAAFYSKSSLDYILQELKIIRAKYGFSRFFSDSKKEPDSRYLSTFAQDEDIYLNVLSLPEPKLDNIPLRVISRSLTEQSSSYDKAWNKWQKQLIELSKNSQHFYSSTSSHMIQIEDPDLVIKVIKDLVLELNNNSLLKKSLPNN